MAFGISINVKNSAQAVKTYMAAFALELGYHVLNDDKSFFHSELMQDGKEVLNVVEDNRQICDSPIILSYTFNTKAELEKAFDILKENGKIKMELCTLPWSPYAAEVIDCFGVDWYLTLQQHKPDDDFVPSKYSN